MAANRCSGALHRVTLTLTATYIIASDPGLLLNRSRLALGIKDIERVNSLFKRDNL
jgi:hypothetical protein